VPLAIGFGMCGVLGAAWFALRDHGYGAALSAAHPAATDSASLPDAVQQVATAAPQVTPVPGSVWVDSAPAPAAAPAPVPTQPTPPALANNEGRAAPRPMTSAFRHPLPFVATRPARPAPVLVEPPVVSTAARAPAPAPAENPLDERK